MPRRCGLPAAAMAGRPRWCDETRRYDGAKAPSGGPDRKGVVAVGIEAEHQVEVLHRRTRRALAEIVHACQQQRMAFALVGEDIDFHPIGAGQRVRVVVIARSAPRIAVHQQHHVVMFLPFDFTKLPRPDKTQRGRPDAFIFTTLATHSRWRPLPRLVLALVLTVVASEVSYRLVERRLRARPRRLAAPDALEITRTA